MKIKQILAIVGWCTASLMGCGTEDDRNADLMDVTNMSRGGLIYRENCAGCHGDDGRGGKSNDCLGLISPHIKKQSDGQLYTFIAFGTGGSMPSFRDVLSQDEIIMVIEHLRDLNDAETMK